MSGLDAVIKDPDYMIQGVSIIEGYPKALHQILTSPGATVCRRVPGVKLMGREVGLLRGTHKGYIIFFSSWRKAEHAVCKALIKDNTIKTHQIWSWQSAP